MRAPDELRDLVEGYVSDLALTPELHGQSDAVRYALVGGKRVRGVICLASAEAAGTDAETALPAAAALELVHAFSLVHDDLPALDNDSERRGRASVWAQHGEAVAILAGDALLAEAFRLALSYPFPHVGRELAQATLGMIGGQYLDVTGLRAGRGDAAPAEDRLPVRGLCRRCPVGGGGSEVTSRLRGARSEMSSACCSRSSTTSSTETATSSHTARTSRARSRTKPPRARTSACATCLPIRRR